MGIQMNYALLGQRIREHRNARHLTQEQLAELAGIGQQFICKLESGKGIPSLRTFQALCIALQVEPTVLLRYTATEDPSAPTHLRSPDTIPYLHALSDALFAGEDAQSFGALDIGEIDFPFIDLILPDTDDNPFAPYPQEQK